MKFPWGESLQYNCTMTADQSQAPMTDSLGFHDTNECQSGTIGVEAIEVGVNIRPAGRGSRTIRTGEAEWIELKDCGGDELARVPG